MRRPALRRRAEGGEEADAERDGEEKSDDEEGLPRFASRRGRSVNDGSRR